MPSNPEQGRILTNPEEIHQRHLAEASPEVLALAQALQRLAFPHLSKEGGWEPAPIYLQQAAVLAQGSRGGQYGAVYIAFAYAWADARKEEKPK